MSDTKEIATFGAGCFWGVEEAFRVLPGVVSTRVGYMGGKKENPTYKDVCSHKTGHVEVTEVTFDPSVVTYSELLDKFWEVHDPTQLNRQGPDVGDQYRSVVFVHNEGQSKLAKQSLGSIVDSDKYKNPVVTTIEPAVKFWQAEDYHQQYLLKTGSKVCH